MKTKCFFLVCVSGISATATPDTSQVTVPVSTSATVILATTMQSIFSSLATTGATGGLGPVGASSDGTLDQGLFGLAGLAVVLVAVVLLIVLLRQRQAKKQR